MKDNASDYDYDKIVNLVRDIPDNLDRSKKRPGLKENSRTRPA